LEAVRLSGMSASASPETPETVMSETFWTTALRAAPRKAFCIR